MSFVSPPCGVVGTPFMATLNLPGLTIGLHVWLFSNPFIPNASFVSDPGPLPHQHQPHVNPSPSSSNVESTSLSSSSPVEKSNVSKGVGKKKTKTKAKKKNTKQKVTTPTFDLHVGIPLDTDHHVGSIMYLFPTHVNLSSLVYFSRVITLLRTIPVFPLCQKCGLNILYHQSLIMMLMMPPQPVTLWLRDEKERLDILA